MQTYFIGFLSGVISVIAVGIFIWTIKRRKTDTPGTLENDIDRNNTDIRRGLNGLGDNNKESGKIIDDAQNVATEGLEGIKDTRRTVSEIIAAASRKGSSND